MNTSKVQDKPIDAEMLSSIEQTEFFRANQAVLMPLHWLMRERLASGDSLLDLCSASKLTNK